MTPEKQIILDVYQALGDVDAPDYFLTKIRDLISKHCQMNGVFDIDRIERIAFVKQLRARGNSKKITRDRLMARYSVSRAQAYRIIADASQNRAINENE